MRVVSFNINGIRARMHQLHALRERYDPDIIGLQETKVTDEDFPRDLVSELGYRVHYFGQKGHYGVALLSKQEPSAVLYGFPFDPGDAQRRLISGVFDAPGGPLVVLNGYFPQGESRDHAIKFPAKRRFYADMQRHLCESFSPQSRLLVMGDMNVAPSDQDVGIGEDSAKRWLRTGKCSFLPEEREWIEGLGRWGLHDTFRGQHPQVDDRFSWFDYRSRGFEREPKRGLRIDLVLATESLDRTRCGAGIAYDIRAMERPSDHCPVWADFHLEWAQPA